MSKINLIPFLNKDGLYKAILADPSIINLLEKDQLREFINHIDSESYTFTSQYGHHEGAFLMCLCDQISRKTDKPINIEKDREMIKKHLQLRRMKERLQDRYLEISFLGEILQSID